MRFLIPFFVLLAFLSFSAERDPDISIQQSGVSFEVIGEHGDLATPTGGEVKMIKVRSGWCLVILTRRPRATQVPS